MEIKPCPYCAGPSGINRGISVNNVGCGDVLGCGYRGPQRRTEEAAIKVHNKVDRRLDPEKVLAVLDAIEHAFDEMTDTVDGLAFCGSVDAIQGGLDKIRALAGGGRLEGVVKCQFPYWSE